LFDAKDYPDFNRLDYLLASKQQTVQENLVNFQKQFMEDLFSHKPEALSLMQEVTVRRGSPQDYVFFLPVYNRFVDYLKDGEISFKDKAELYRKLVPRGLTNLPFDSDQVLQMMRHFWPQLIRKNEFGHRLSWLY